MAASNFLVKYLLALRGLCHDSGHDIYTLSNRLWVTCFLDQIWREPRTVVWNCGSGDIRSVSPYHANRARIPRWRAFSSTYTGISSAWRMPRARFVCGKWASAWTWVNRTWWVIISGLCTPCLSENLRLVTSKFFTRLIVSNNYLVAAFDHPFSLYAPNFPIFHTMWSDCQLVNLFLGQHSRYATIRDI